MKNLKNYNNMKNKKKPAIIVVDVNESSVIEAMIIKPPLRQAEISFKESDSIYTYPISQKVARKFINAAKNKESVGHLFNAHLRGHETSKTM